MSAIPKTNAPLKVYTTVNPLRANQASLKKASKTIGFVPTMGALHTGHLSLIRLAARDTDSITVSIFVNPSQFAPHEDLATYPRTLESDIAKLHSLNTEFASSDTRGRIESLFLPTVDEMYPSGIMGSHGVQPETAQKGAFVMVEPLARKQEGLSRPHFFRGVATVVTKLFNAVQPDIAWFGQKDVQQSIILKRMVKDLLMPVEVRVGPTGREADGLAMSSRNVYLSEPMRKVAPKLFQALQEAEKNYWELAAKGPAVERSKALETARSLLENAGGSTVEVEVEYFCLADLVDLEETDWVDVKKGAVLSAAIRLREGGKEVRLLDNIILEGKN